MSPLSKNYSSGKPVSRVTGSQSFPHVITGAEFQRHKNTLSGTTDLFLGYSSSGDDFEVKDQVFKLILCNVKNTFNMDTMLWCTHPPAPWDHSTTSGILLGLDLHVDSLAMKHPLTVPGTLAWPRWCKEQE